MKKAMRILSIVFATLIVLCSCQGSEPEVIPDYDFGDGDSANLDGYVVKWGYSISHNDDEDTVFGFIPNTVFADTVLERKNDIEKSYNCVIEMDYKSFGTVHSNMKTSIMSGTPYYDIVTDESFELIGSVRAGYFTGLSSLLDVKNTDKYGTPNMLQSLAYKDDLYCVLPFAWPDLLYTSFSAPIVVNESLITQYGHTDPREYVENGTWTWDTFEECLQAYTVKEGDRTIYGMQTHNPYFSVMMFLSNGVTLTEFTENGVQCGLYTEAGRTAMERLVSIRKETCSDCFEPTDSADPTNFKAGDVVLLATPSGNIIGDVTSIMYEMENVGILPFPQGPNATTGVYTSFHESIKYATGIPANAEDVEVSALVINKMFEPFEGYETKEDIINYFNNQVFFDKRDASVFVNMLSNTEYSFYAEGARTVLESILSSSTTITQALDGNEEKYETIVSTYMEPHYEGRVAVYGE